MAKRDSKKKNNKQSNKQPKEKKEMTNKKAVDPNEELAKAAKQVNTEASAAKGEIKRPWKTRKVSAMERALATLKSLVYIPKVGEAAKNASGLVGEILTALQSFPADFTPPRNADASGFNIGEEIQVKADCDRYAWCGIHPGARGKVLAMQGAQLFVDFGGGRCLPVMASTVLPVRAVSAPTVAEAEDVEPEPEEETEETEE